MFETVLDDSIHLRNNADHAANRSLFSISYGADAHP
jgi:hypothetical protein